MRSLFMLLMLSLSAYEARAEEPLQVYGSIFGGPALTTTGSSLSKGHFSFGLHAGLTPTHFEWGDVSFGVAFQAMNEHEKGDNVGAFSGPSIQLRGETLENNVWLIPVQVEALVHPKAAQGLYFGLRTGVSIVSRDFYNSIPYGASSKSSSTSGHFTVSPVIGYTVPIYSKINVGLDVSWTMIFSYRSPTSIGEIPPSNSIPATPISDQPHSPSLLMLLAPQVTVGMEL